MVSASPSFTSIIRRTRVPFRCSRTVHCAVLAAVFCGAMATVGCSFMTISGSWGPRRGVARPGRCASGARSTDCFAFVHFRSFTHALPKTRHTCRGSHDPPSFHGNDPPSLNTSALNPKVCALLHSLEAPLSASAATSSVRCWPANFRYLQPAKQHVRDLPHHRGKSSCTGECFVTYWSQSNARTSCPPLRLCRHKKSTYIESHCGEDCSYTVVLLRLTW